MKICIWMNIPSHHQSQFFDSIYDKDPSLKVIYYQKVFEERKNLGWESVLKLKKYEIMINPNNYQINSFELKDYIHIILGYSHEFTIRLRDYFCKNDIKWVHWSEQSSPGWKWYLSYYRKIKHAYYINKYALGAFAISSYARKDFMRWGVNPAKIELLPYSFNSLNEKDSDGLILEYKRNRKSFLFVGSLYRTKGIDVLLKAFANEFKDDPNWCLILVGKENAHINYKLLVRKLKIEDQVFFRGVVQSSEIMSVYKSSDVFILPSRYDGWGMVASEAIYCGKPVIISDSAGSSQHLVDINRNGYIFKSGDIKGLARTMRLYKINSLLSEHGNNSKLLFKNFNSDAMSQHFLEVLKRWMKNNETIS